MVVTSSNATHPSCPPPINAHYSTQYPWATGVLGTSSNPQRLILPNCEAQPCRSSSAATEGGILAPRYCARFNLPGDVLNDQKSLEHC